MDAMVSPSGHRVEQVLVLESLSRPPRPTPRVRHCYYVADCATEAEVATYVDLADLVPEQRI